MIKRIEKILVANRGEIAIRVMRTAKQLGIDTVAVYSQADAAAPHTKYADECVYIGPAPVSASYLNSEAIIDAALDVGADAIHPGYGFLSENASFAYAVEAAGLVFIGPSGDAIDLMGNKAEAKRRMIKAGVPCVPGYEGEDQSDDVLLAEGHKIGFPIMVKAAAGGGGRGMRLVHEAGELANAITTARSEATNAFGSGELILEKAIIKPRHVEVQVFGDRHGNVIHFGERDCSVQRRHQKVIEEAPCPVMTPDLREKMGAAAVEAAKSIDYHGAGTVEFLLDANGAFYFLEMNTRLQVEHPVTEEVTGYDLVALQISVAEGHPLGLEQADIMLMGHAIEVRLYAEDPANGFLPSTGHIEKWAPAEGEGLRFDVGIESGQDISPFYDPMIAKVIAYGETREIARRRLVNGLANTALYGFPNNRDFLIDCLEQDTFIAGEATTAFIGECFGDDGHVVGPPDQEVLVGLALAHYSARAQQAMSSALNIPNALLNFSSAGALRTILRLQVADEIFEACIQTKSPSNYEIDIVDVKYDVSVYSIIDDVIDCAIDGVRTCINTHAKGATVFASIEGRTYVCVDVLSANANDDEGQSSGRISAPMHGRVVEVFVNKGDGVVKGDRLAIVEAMKMQHEITSGVNGNVLDVFVKFDQQVAAGDMMIEIVSIEEEA